MMMFPTTLDHNIVETIFQSSLIDHKPENPYEVLTLYREFDNVCVVRLQGFDNTVFWKEINLAPKFNFGKSPRQKIVEAQEKAKKRAEQLRWRDMQAKHEYDLSIRP